MQNTLTTKERRSQRWAYQGKHDDYSFRNGKPLKKKFFALYGIFRKSPMGDVEGYVENSFSMGWNSNHVLTMNHSMALPELKKMLKDSLHKQFLKNGYKYFVYRVTRKSEKAEIRVYPPDLNADHFQWRNWRFDHASNIPF